jgi:chromosome segregation ATPase
MSGTLDEMEKPFETLGLNLTASEDEINRQWRRLMLQVHPDKLNGDEAQTKLYNEAREKAIKIVRDPARKQKELDYKHQRFIRMIEFLFNEIDKMDHNYTNAKFKGKTQKWTPEQLREAEDAVQYGLSDSRKLLHKARARAEELQSALQLETERANQAKAQNEDWEQRCAAQQTEIKRMEEQICDLRQQSDAKDEVIQGKDAELAQCKQKLSEVEQCLAAADTKAAEWEQRFLAKCEEVDAKAKEWETKCSVLQESLDQVLADNARSEAQVGTEVSDSKKRKHVKHFGTKEEELTFKNTISSFLQARFQESQSAFVPTKTIHKFFTEHTGHTPNNQLFYKHLRDQMSIIFPTATICDRRFFGERERGYNGIQLMS